MSNFFVDTDLWLGQREKLPGASGSHFRKCFADTPLCDAEQVVPPKYHKLFRKHVWPKIVSPDGGGGSLGAPFFVIDPLGVDPPFRVDPHFGVNPFGADIPSGRIPFRGWIPLRGGFSLAGWFPFRAGLPFVVDPPFRGQSSLGNINPYRRRYRKQISNHLHNLTKTLPLRAPKLKCNDMHLI